VTLLVSLPFLLIASLVLAEPNQINLDAARFSMMEPGNIQPPWRVTGLRGRPRTEYRLVEDGGKVVVEAQSSASVAALVWDLSLDPTEYPVIHWEWRVANLLESSDIATRKGDDFPARVYVTFDYDLRRLSWLARTKIRVARLLYGDSVPAAALCYVWDREAPAGTVTRNAYTERVGMIVVESGGERLNEWVPVTRNIYDDFVRAFHEEPPRISGIVLTTDTDDTGESARAWFGDVMLSVAPREVQSGLVPNQQEKDHDRPIE